MTPEELILCEKAARIETSKKIDVVMVKNICEQGSSNLDSLLKLDGKLTKSISTSTTIPVLVQESLSDSFLLALPSYGKLLIGLASHIHYAWSESKKIDSERREAVLALKKKESDDEDE